VKSINSAVRIIMARARLYGLDKITEPVEPERGRLIVDPGELARRSAQQRRRDDAVTAAWFDERFGPDDGT
jgi:hypothetical protein